MRLPRSLVAMYCADCDVFAIDTQLKDFGPAHEKHRIAIPCVSYIERPGEVGKQVRLQAFRRLAQVINDQLEIDKPLDFLIPMNERPIKVVKPKEQPERSRAEYTLLYELIQRNPEKAKEFLRRLGQSLKLAA